MPEFSTTPPPNVAGRNLVSRSFLANVLLILLSVGLGVWAFQLMRERFTSIASRDAVINGALIDINSPIEGIVSEFSAATGAAVTSDQTLAIVNNPNLVAPASRLPAQEIKTQITEFESERDTTIRQLAETRALIELWSQEQSNQQQLEMQNSQDSILEVQADLEAMRSRYRLAEITYQRSTTLLEAGAISQATLDEAQLEREELSNQVKSLQAQLESAQNQEQAVTLGLTLERERSETNPRIRLQTLKLQAVTQQQAITQLERNIQAARAELAQATTEYQLEQTELNRTQRTTIKPPTEGVIWDVTARQGQFVEKGANLGRVLDCQRRWVDVYVDEQALRSLRHGMPATIQLYGDQSLTLRGRVSLVRSGVGRLQAGQDVAVPIAPNLPRTTQVRVDLDLNTPQGSPDAMCFVGYTAQVSFHL
ncbi:MAG: HlyD family efflux transporter periplasmic adaptor subunit [Leptolyngbyaceae cyanobacterium SM1_3_5]|nr:HlyD family efflux transporter periplasmic adaptor subunit [Leptolyngbyaceae cyanobacterium SM1_3_5]